ncbi:hypothetical protein [Paenibacillus tundrae]|uniref:hypothetical protein n=1 Tax=Paenibacillus tundrae TaxID=528187 RepID=UPI0030D45E4C
MKEKIVIDSIDELVSHIINAGLTDIDKNELINRTDSIGLHFTLGMYIRNHYELFDPMTVPNLIREYKILNHIPLSYEDVAEEERGFHEFIDNMNVSEDAISHFIVNVVWQKLKQLDN